jgi:hypothetical protein
LASIAARLAVLQVAAQPPSCAANELLQFERAPGAATGRWLCTAPVRTTSTGGWCLASEAMNATVHAMNAHRPTVRLQRAAFNALDSLLSFLEPQAPLNAGKNAHRAGAVDAVINTLRAHPADVAVQEAGCRLLSSLCISDKQNARRACFGDDEGGGAFLRDAHGPAAVLTITRTHPNHAGVQRFACLALSTMFGADRRIMRDRELMQGAVVAFVTAMRLHPLDMRVQSNACLGLYVIGREQGTHMPIVTGTMEAVVSATHVEFSAESSGGVGVSVGDARSNALKALHSLIAGNAAAEVRAVCAGALEAVTSNAVKACRRDRAFTETCRHGNGNEFLTQLTAALQAAAQRHDAAPCTHDGCKRCGLRASGAMCALPGCGQCKRADGSGKKLLRCGRCMAAAYCGAAHQREHWRRHKPLCAPQQAAPQQEPADDAD